MDTAFFTPLPAEQFAVLVLVAALVGAIVGLVQAWRGLEERKRNQNGRR